MRKCSGTVLVLRHRRHRAHVERGLRLRHRGGGARGARHHRVRQFAAARVPLLRPAARRAARAHLSATAAAGGLQSWFGRRLTRAARQLHTLFIEVNEVTDKTENALKIAGDVYTARLFTLVAARLGLDDWKASVREKLKTLDDIYRFAVEQTAMARGELLELTIVLILVLELVLFFLGIMRSSADRAGHVTHRKTSASARRASSRARSGRRIVVCTVVASVREVPTMVFPATVLQSEIDALLGYLPLVRDGDVEGVHGARVVTRRLREALPLFARSFPDDVRRVKRIVKRAGRRLGSVRELDVMDAELSGAPPGCRWRSPR